MALSDSSSAKLLDPGQAFGGHLNDAVSDFGAAVAPILRRGKAEREATIREPFVRMLTRVARSLGFKIHAHPEVRIAPLGLRLDYAVDISGVPVGHIELKQPGKGVPDHGWRPTSGDRLQWEKLQLLPNLLYSDGSVFALYRWGTLVGEVALLAPELGTAGARLHPVNGRLASLLFDFLLWSPDPGPSLGELIRNVAGLCQLLRDEVLSTIELERSGQADRMYTQHLVDWRAVWSDSLTEAEFADAFAQTVTFGLLLARSTGVAFEGRAISDIGEKLTKNHLLVGRALSILTSRTDGGRSPEECSTVIQTLRRVVEAVRSELITGDARSVHLLYETFLERYDPALRRRSGSYYTPKSLAAFMVQFVHEVVRTRLKRRRGLAEPDVVIIDPAMGTGTFLTQVVDQVAEAVKDDGGDVPAELRALLSRLIGFEWQVSPFAVAELQMHLELARHGVEVSDERLRLHVANTLDDADTLPSWFPAHYDPIAQSMRRANRVKTDEPVMVVLGNPPYLERARQLGAGVLAGKLLDAFRQPGLGRLEFKLHNLNIYFWRWATWKAFDAHHDHPEGVIAFVSTSAFTTGPGFAGMREYLRRNADEGWIVDLTPEGHQPSVDSRLFPGVMQPICVGVFARRGPPDLNSKAKIHYLPVSGDRGAKADRLTGLGLDDPEWRECQDDWSAPFRPVGEQHWQSYLPIEAALPWSAPGVKPNRTWVYAPDHDTLLRRWRRLVLARPDEKPTLMKETRDRTVHRRFPPTVAGGEPLPSLSEARPEDSPATVASVGYRSFDQQYLLLDPRVVDFKRSELWRAWGDGQVGLTMLHTEAVRSGPAVTVSPAVPDMHHYMGHHGGRVHPLYRDAAGNFPNLPPRLVPHLEQRLGNTVEPDELFMYLCGVLAHSGFTERFATELREPGVRVPVTAEPQLWRAAVRLGRQVVCLHSYGQRYSEAVPDWRALRPHVLCPVPGSAEEMPETINHDPATAVLHVGAGQLGPVSEAAWRYEVSGMPVVRKWFSYRKRTPSGRRSSPLDDTNADRWSNSRTEQLRDLIAVLEGCIALEPAQADLLDRICAGPLITVAELESARILPIPASARRPLSNHQPSLLEPPDGT